MVSRTLALAGLLFLAFPATSFAEWQFTPFIGWTFQGATTLFDFEGGAEETHWNFGGAVTLIGDGPIGLEGYYVRTPGFFESEMACTIATCVTSSRTYALMGNVVLTIPRHWNRYGLRPFVSGGAGFVHAFIERAQDPFPTDLNLVGMNLGGGAVGFLTDRVGLRFDLRYFRNIQGPDEDVEFPVGIPPIRLRYWTLSTGVVIKY